MKIFKISKNYKLLLIILTSIYLIGSIILIMLDTEKFEIISKKVHFFRIYYWIFYLVFIFFISVLITSTKILILDNKIICYRFFLKKEIYFKNIKEIKFDSLIIYLFYINKKNKLKKHIIKYIMFKNKNDIFQEFSKINNLIKLKNEID